MRGTRQVAAIVVGWALSVSSAGAYYHYVHYTSATPPYQPVPEKIDLSALSNNTITFFVTDAGPKQFAQYDGMPSVLAQVRQATQVWNSVASSRLRVTFGGLYADGTAGATPTGEVVFDDEVPPGLLAITTHTTSNTMATGADGPLFPITRSIIHFRSDLTQAPGPSYTDAFYLTVVHEIGHALGLQHTFTSSVMSTAVTRATTALRPLDADDIAGISLLYPLNFPGPAGTITGTVTANGAGVHMASVVALRPNGSAISALSNPDGTYRIDGIPPGTYFVYVQPLPSTANITSPKDVNGNSVNPGGPFDGVFYPGVTDLGKATVVTVNAGASSDGINFSVRPRSSIPIFDVSTYSYYGQAGVHPAYVNIVPGGATIAAAGTGLGMNGQATAGLGVSVIGSALIATGGLRAYGSTPTYLALDLKFMLGASNGPQHLVFSQGSNVYVLPRAVNLVNSDPPSIGSVSTVASGNLAVTGSNFAEDGLVYFDGLPAATTVVDSAHATAVPPPGVSNQNAVVTVYNGDGQNSMFFAPAVLPAYSYTSANSPVANALSLALSPASLPAGARAMVDIRGVNTNFVDGFMSVGFGTSDVLVRRIWVLSPTHALVNVQVAPNAQLGSSYATLISGFQVVSQPAGFQILAANPSLPIVEPTLINAVWLPSGAFPGSIVSLFGVNLGGSQTTLTINNQPAQILYASPTQINLIVPASLQPGPAILRLNNGTTNAYPVVVSIGAVPPAIVTVQDVTNGGSNVNAAAPANPGDVLKLVVRGLAAAGATVPPASVQVTAGGRTMTAGQVSPASDSTYAVEFTLDRSIAAGAQVPVTVSIDGKTSLPVHIPIT